MIARKTAPVITRFRLWLRTFLASGTTRRKSDRVRFIRPALEALEDRTLLSAPAGNALLGGPPVSPPPAPAVTALLSYVVERVNQWHHLVETVQQEAFGFWTAVGQNIAHEVSFFEQQWDRLLGINPNPQHQSINSTVPQHGSSSDTGQPARPVVLSHAPPPPLHMTPLDAPPAGPPPPPPLGTVYLSSSNYPVLESTGHVDVVVELSSPTQQLVTVQLSTFDGTATAGIDYGAENNIGVNFRLGDYSQIVSVPIFDDGASDEGVGSEYFTVQLANPTNATLGNPSSAAVTILEASPPPPPSPPTVSFSSSTYSVTEGGTATITATLSSPATQPISVSYAATDGTASSSGTDVDYNSTSGTLNFPLNSSSASFNVTTIEDNDQSNNPETVNLTLSNPVGANAGLMNATLNINEGSPPPPPPPPYLVQGTVWTDSNEDGILDSGELGKSEISVTLDIEVSQGVFETYETTTTDSNGNYQFQVSSSMAGQYFQIYVSIPDGSEATIENARGTGTTSNIDDLGYSAIYFVAPQVVINAGLVTPSLAVLLPDQSELCDCGCPNEEGDLLQDDEDTEAPDDPPESTDNPVRYADGVVSIAQTDLHSDGFGFPWGQTRSWTNGSLYTAGSDNGNGWVDTYTPHLIEADGYTTNTLIYIANGNTAYYYDLVDGVYQPRIDDGSHLTYNSGNDTYTLTDTQGDQIVFTDFNASQTARRGQFTSFTSPGGVAMNVTSWTSDGHIAEMQRSVTSNGNTTTESWLYSYLISTDPNAGLLSGVTLRTQINGGAWNIVRQVQYSYYDGTQTYGGSLGDLMNVIVKDGNGTALDISYYRYYVSGEAKGYTHGLKYVFNPDSYDRLTAARSGDLSSLTDAQVASYADNYFQYDSQQRVTQEAVQGTGSSSSGGLGTYTFSYTPSGNTAGFNSWSMKTIVGDPDGSSDTVYTNAYGQVLLADHYEPTSGSHTNQFYLYSINGQLVLTAAPSAISGFSDANYDLLNNSQGYADLNSNSGLITRYDYYATTTAAETTAGGVARYLEDEQIQQGLDGTLIPQETWQYYAHSYNGQTIAPLASDTVYRNDDGSGAETTSSAYTWYTNTAQIQSETDTAPVISASENGPSTPDVITTYYDAYGNAQWTKDADGYIQYDAYDPVTGGLREHIDDVNTSNSSDFTNLPAGWSTPAGGGLTLATTDQVDALGRTTEETSPNGNITYYVYLDSQHEERIYQGWNSSTNTATLPTEVIRDDGSGTYSEDLTMTATPHLTGSAPDGSEAIGNVISLTRDYVNDAGQLTSEYAYNYLYGLTYSTGAMGTLNTNYYQTTYSYDSAGRLFLTTTPNGTLYETVYNSLDDKVSAWVGTSPSNVVQTASYQYDSDGDLTQETDYPGLNAANRVTEYWYDWRDRLVAEKDGVQSDEYDGVNRPIVVTSYDNLDEVSQTQQYLGDSVTPSIVNGVLQALDPTKLRAQESDSYDDQGRVYQTQVFDIPSPGASPPTP